ncbi:hypothetical protein HO133_000710 [Letharia lupina]|uniref:Uncharacterized protein n=1 Tax=Letharia lupina TaxID=560253 RepID=A0A8H6FCB4_9LECA|nr:uncharacterized protein HO133_000710 [Letharia lupina]KAF6222663.1 hypothetical protein HO133_000710 [Letharia lupina]
MSQPKQADAEHKATAFYIRFKAELAANVYTEVVYAVNKERMEENGPIAATDDLKIVCKVEVTVDSPKKYYQEFQDSAKDAEIVWDLSFAADVTRDLMQEATVFTRFTPCLTKHHHRCHTSAAIRNKPDWTLNTLPVLLCLRTAAAIPFVTNVHTGIFYQGTSADDVEQSQSVSYAEDTSGANRFAPPVPYLLYLIS